MRGLKIFLKDTWKHGRLLGRSKDGGFIFWSGHLGSIVVNTLIIKGDQNGRSGRSR